MRVYYFRRYLLSNLVFLVRCVTNLPQIIEDRRQSEARNFETAQHIDKQITVSKHDYIVVHTKRQLG